MLFKQKPAYEMRISDGSSDVCSSVLPSAVRSASDAGSRSSLSGTLLASACSAAVRLRMNTGLPRQLALMAWPGWIAETSTSIEASASTSADGFIWLTSGITAVAAPTPAKETAAMVMKSRRRTRTEEHTSELQSLMRISYAVFCLKQKKKT